MASSDLQHALDLMTGRWRSQILHAGVKLGVFDAAADEFARLAYQRWMLEGVTPEQLRDRRAPGMSDQRRLRKWKQLKAKGFIAGAMS